MRLVFGSDHAGFSLRQSLASAARSKGHEVDEVGAPGLEAFDYPDASDLVVRTLRDSAADFGVLICGTGIGVSIRANRHSGIRAAVCCSVGHAEMARKHNHANVLCLGARVTTEPEAEKILTAFLETPEDHEERHERRVRKLDGNPDGA
ncbi:MAG: ribose 5-phosphate isomerase B [Armatimonadetes bacterium]|nr:ribose 5-phosphate isomerase B [Armatimonadota bacterium]